MMRKFIFGLMVVSFGIAGFLVLTKLTDNPVKPPATVQNKPDNKVPLVGNTFNKGRLSTADSGSLWVVVNKQHALKPKDYVPANLVVPNVPLRVPGSESMRLSQPNASALEQMFTAADKDGIKLMLSSGYRPYDYQVNLYNGYVTSKGQAWADNISARPGYSEHQTGLAADIEPTSKACELDACFGETAEGKWLATNAYKYGYIIRYPADKVDITGYDYEPWHVRFVGTDLSNEMHNSKITTLEEFFNINGGKSY